MESNLSGLVPAAGLVPALPPAVTLGLTAAYTTLYALLFFSVYAQLWLVLLYGHKRLSYQTVFLALCLLWAALRTTLFSFYFRDTPRANRLGPLPFWLLYCCPVCLQFFTLTLMNLYFAQVVFKAKAKRRPEMSRGLGPVCARQLRWVVPWFCFMPAGPATTWQPWPWPPGAGWTPSIMTGTTSLIRAPAASSTGRSLAPVPTSSTGHTARMRAALGSTAGHVRQPRLQQLVRCHRAGARLVRGQPDADHSSALLPGFGTRQPPSQSLLYPTDVIPLHLPPEPPDPSPSHPRPLCQVHLPLLARDPGGCGCLFPRPAPCYSCCSELVLSPRMGGMALAARCS
nr:integral membrane protein GPR137 isoform X5 [Kogia breviceps]